jgi:hypothetical protein
MPHAVADKVTGSSCCVCGATDARSLVDVVLIGGAKATLCGSHALMHRRSPAQARSSAQLRAMLADRRDRRDRRTEGDELGSELLAAFSGDRRAGDRRLSG